MPGVLQAIRVGDEKLVLVMTHCNETVRHRDSADLKKLLAQMARSSHLTVGHLLTQGWPGVPDSWCWPNQNTVGCTAPDRTGMRAMLMG